MPKNKVRVVEGGEGVVQQGSKAILEMSGCSLIYFNGRAMILDNITVPGYGQYAQYVPLHKDNFERLAYPILGGVSRSRIADVMAYMMNTAPDCTMYANYVLMGDKVWDMSIMSFTSEVDKSKVVWRCPFTPGEGRSSFLMDLAGGKESHYEDILQSIAPIIMGRKPDGVIWWVGSGANGKSSLMEALYRLFPGQLASLTVKRLTDERDTPMLNGHLANVVKESSEGRIEDTQVYKSIGTHEDFRVHKFHNQDSLVIRGNMHHIFSANQIPLFNDKGYSARRRTFIIPFNQVFESRPDFNEQTFTKEMLSTLLGEMIRVAGLIKERLYQYKFSALTLNAKIEYDAEANNAEEYVRELIDDGIVGFDSYKEVRIDYENWCAAQSFVPLGPTSMRRALQQQGFERRSVRGYGSISKLYVLVSMDASDLLPMGFGKMGFYTREGFERKVPESDRKKEYENEQRILAEWGL